MVTTQTTFPAALPVHFAQLEAWPKVLATESRVEGGIMSLRAWNRSDRVSGSSGADEAMETASESSSETEDEVS